MNIVTADHDFNKPIRFGRAGFAAFVETLVEQKPILEKNIRVLEDDLGNIYSFQMCPTAKAHECAAVIIPDLSGVTLKQNPIL